MLVQPAESFAEQSIYEIIELPLSVVSGDRTGRPAEWPGAVLLSPPVGQHRGDQPGPATAPQQQQQQP